jgi:hypothetical protein
MYEYIYKYAYIEFHLNKHHHHHSFASVGSSACHCVIGFTWIEDPATNQIEGKAVNNKSKGGKGSCQPEIIVCEKETILIEEVVYQNDDWEEDL